MPTIYDAFLPLADRLATIKGNNIPKDTLLDYEYGQLVHNIEVNANRFSVADRVRVVEEYYTTISSLLKELLASLPIEITKIERPVNSEFNWENERPESETIPKEVFLLEELEFYNEWVSKKREALKEITYNESPQDLRPVINLPEKFRLNDFNQHFNSGLTPEQAVLFLNYLVERKIIANYNYTSLGTLAKYLFGKSDDNARKDFGNLHSLKNKEDLNALKAVFAGIIEDIDKDLVHPRR